MKTRIKVLIDDAYQEKRYKKGETGYIDGYLTDKDGTPLVAVVVDKRLIFIKPYVFEVIKTGLTVWLRRLIRRIE